MADAKLTIQTKSVDILAKAVGRPYETIDTLFNYDRGSDIDRLDGHPRGKRLYEIVVRELG